MRLKALAWLMALVCSSAAALAQQPVRTEPTKPEPAPAPPPAADLPNSPPVAGPPVRPELKLDAQGGWQPVATPAPGTDEAVIAEARKLLAENNPDRAYTVINDWIDAKERSGSPLLPAAYLARGDALTAGGDEFDALYDYETLIKQFAGSPEYITAVERELEIGVKYVNGLDRKFWGIRFVDATDLGEELLIRVQERLPGSRLAERAGIELADHYYRTRDLELANEAYDLFLQNYPNSAYRMKAMQRRIYSALARFKGPRYDGTPLQNAQVLIKRFMSLYPAEAQQAGLDEALLTRIDESAGQQLLTTAKWYIGTGDLVSARYTLRELLKKHPFTGAADEAVRIVQARGWEAPTPPALPSEPTPPGADGGESFPPLPTRGDQGAGQ